MALIWSILCAICFGVWKNSDAAGFAMLFFIWTIGGAIYEVKDAIKGKANP